MTLVIDNKSKCPTEILKPVFTASCRVMRIRSSDLLLMVSQMRSMDREQMKGQAFPWWFHPDETECNGCKFYWCRALKLWVAKPGRTYYVANQMAKDVMMVFLHELKHLVDMQADKEFDAIEAVVEGTCVPDWHDRVEEIRAMKRVDKLIENGVFEKHREILKPLAKWFRDGIR